MATTLDFLIAAGGQRSLHSGLGLWARTMAVKIDGGLAGTRLVDLLIASGVSLHTPFGRWALQMSQEIDAGAVDKVEVADKFRAMGSYQQLSGHYADFEINAMLRAP